MEQRRDGDGLGDNKRHQQQQQHAMVADDEQELRLHHHPFTKQFTAALHCLLISCSRQEILSFFAHFQPRHRDFVYKVYMLSMRQIHENVGAEFRSICERTQVLEALDHVNSEDFLASIDVRPSISPRNVVREVGVKRKQEEVNMMKQKLQQTKDENRSLATQLEGLREMVNEAEDLRSVDGLIEKISNINLKPENVFGGDT